MTIKNGTAGADTLIGTTSADQLFGKDGNDILKGLAGPDLLGLCCTDEGGRRSNPQPRPGLGDADVIWTSQLQHAVEHVDRHVHLGGPALVRMGA
jgi:hypothetical protein